MDSFNKIITSVLCIAAALSAGAAVITPEQALQRLQSDSNVPARVRASRAASTPRLIYTGKDASSRPAVYIFSDESGFLLASANDIAPALLGYGDEPISSEEQISPELKWWMEEYGRQIQWGEANGITCRPAKRLMSDYSKMQPVGPLLSTKWNQGEPYNDMCPVVNGQRCVTGCVATAISQIMNYHQWPNRGKGVMTYTPESINQTLTVNFSRTTFDWANMLDNYDNGATKTQKEAVANLMYAVGVGVKMGYSPEGSGATDIESVKALLNFFSYQDGIVSYWRDWHVNLDWEQLVYDELSTNGPLYYSGSSTTGAHAFVCDGYSGDGYFHINWGWGGMSDGYFLLQALTPPSQGIGGSSDGYNFGQTIIGRVRPDRNGVERQEVIPVMAGEGFEIREESVELGEYATLINGVYNFTGTPISGMLGMKAVDAKGKTYYCSGFEFENLEYFTGFVEWPLLIQDIPEGTYRVSPAVRAKDGKWYDVGIGARLPRTTTMVVEGNRAGFHKSSATPVKAISLEPKSDFYLGSYFALDFTLENTEDVEFTGKLMPVFVDRDHNPVLAGTEWPVYLKAGEAMNVPDYYSQWYTYGGSYPAGTYYLCMADDSGNVISDYIEVTVNETATPRISVSDFKMEGDLSRVDKNNIRASARVTCDKGFFSNVITMYIFPYVEGQSVVAVDGIPSDPIFLSAGQSKTVDFIGAFPGGEPGGKYFAHLYLNEFLTQDAVVFIIDRNSAVEEIPAEIIDREETVYYDLQGRRVENPGHGIYIRVRGGKAEKIVN